MSDAKKITGNQLAEVYRLLGLDPAAWRATNRITIQPNEVTVDRFEKNEAGKIVMAFDAVSKKPQPVQVHAKLEVDWSGYEPPEDLS